MGLRRISFLLCLLAGAPAAAQDSRTVAEPRVPPTCTVLTADLTPQNGTLPDSVERHYRDTARIEKAMRHCAAGQAVVLRAGPSGKSVFLIGPTRMSANVTLVVEPQVALWGSRDPRNYDVQPGSCGIVVPYGVAKGAGCLPLLIAQDAPHAGIMGDGVIDARGGARLLLANGKEGETWWELAHRAKVEDGNQAVPRLLTVRRSNDFTLYQITLRNSPNTHVGVEATDGFTAWGVKADTPKWARNTDGIDPSGSQNLSLIDTYLRTGDDNISPKAPDGAPLARMTVRNTHFYDGHGFGIGSQTVAGVSHIAVTGLSIDGSDNGLRIKSDKSRGGLVEDVAFEDVCMRGVPNPLVFTPVYTTADGTKLPVYRDIRLRNTHALAAPAAPAVTLVGLDTIHRLEASFDNVTVDGLKAPEVTARHASLAIKGGNLEPSGDDVRRTGTTAASAAYNCALAFPPFPQQTSAPVSAEIIPPPDATFYVAADGTGDFYSVQAALDRMPATGGVVSIAPGVYRERVLVRQPHVTLRGTNADAGKTVIVSDAGRDPAHPTRPPNGYATVVVRGSDFRAENLTFQNDLVRPDIGNPLGSEALALRIVGDRNVLRNVRLLGAQHVAYFGALDCQQSSRNPCEAGRTLVLNSYIAGHIDILYGDGLVYFENCEIHSLAHRVFNGAEGYITAQGKHYATQPSGFTFHNARLTADPGVTDVFLGHPWRDFPSVVYLSPVLGAHIGSAGFRERSPEAAPRLQTAFFRIFDPKGPGAPTTAKALSPAETSRYSMHDVLAGKDNWDPFRSP